MISFIYTNKLGDITGIEKDVIDIASKLEVVGLFTACMAKLRENISVASVVDCLILSNENTFDELKQISLSFIAGNLTLLRQDKSWEKLAKHPELVMAILCHVDDSKPTSKC